MSTVMSLSRDESASNFSVMWGLIDNACFRVVMPKSTHLTARNKFMRKKGDQMCEREHVSRIWVGLRNFRVTKNWD